MDIKDIKAQSPVSIEKVLVKEKGEVRSFNKFGKEGRVCNCTISDESGECQLTLWNEEIDSINEGDNLKLEECWAKEWNSKIQVSKGRGNITKL